MIIAEMVDGIKDKLMEIRADFHRHPELSFQDRDSGSPAARAILCSDGFLRRAEDAPRPGGMRVRFVAVRLIPRSGAGSVGLLMGSDVYAVQTHAGKVISTHSANLISLFDPLCWFALVKSFPVYREWNQWGQTPFLLS